MHRRSGLGSGAADSEGEDGEEEEEEEEEEESESNGEEDDGESEFDDECVTPPPPGGQNAHLPRGRNARHPGVTTTTLRAVETTRRPLEQRCLATRA